MQLCQIDVPIGLVEQLPYVPLSLDSLRKLSLIFLIFDLIGPLILKSCSGMFSSYQSLRGVFNILRFKNE